MSREIKFRVVVKEVMYNNLLEISEPLLLEEISYYIKNRKDKDKDCVEEYIFLQYTGLKDVNGIEICEGDILKKHFEYEDETETINDIRNLPSYDLSKSEVIGNVFENPELLNEII